LLDDFADIQFGEPQIKVNLGEQGGGNFIFRRLFPRQRSITG
jgi:hypothetical protein